MRLHERRREERDHHPSTAGMPGAGDVRERGEQLLSLGADAIDRALSTDSAAYLRANRQEGGQ